MGIDSDRTHRLGDVTSARGGQQLDRPVSVLEGPPLEASMDLGRERLSDLLSRLSCRNGTYSAGGMLALACPMFDQVTATMFTANQ